MEDSSKTKTFLDIKDLSICEKSGAINLKGYKMIRNQ